MRIRVCECGYPSLFLVITAFILQFCRFFSPFSLIHRSVNFNVIQRETGGPEGGNRTPLPCSSECRENKKICALINTTEENDGGRGEKGVTTPTAGNDVGRRRQEKKGWQLGEGADRGRCRAGEDATKVVHGKGQAQLRCSIV